MTNIEQTIIDFNITLLDLGLNLAHVCPNSIIGHNIKDVEKLIKNPKNKIKFIEIFVAKVLRYKSDIDSGNEDFFLHKSYDSDLDKDNSLISKVFEFKNIWVQLKQENKDLVKQYMQILCELAQNYFLYYYGS